jgi:hypothetical protein
MTFRVAFSLLTVLISTSCLTVDGMLVSGRVRDVTSEDIRAAVAADIREFPRWRGMKPREVEVVNKDEIRLYWLYPKAVHEGCDIVKRVRGTWQYDSKIVVTS